MKYFFVKRIGNQLILKKNKKGSLHQRAVVIISVVSLSFALCVTLYYSIPALKGFKYSIHLILACTIAFFSAIFFSDFFEQKRIITLLEGAIKINDKYIQKDNIIKIQTSNYVSSELVSDSINVKIITLADNILIAAGVNSVDIDELLNIVKDFIGLQNLEVENVIR
jgi:hypothetical protein